MTQAYVIEWKWGTSRGRHTHGWNICTCYVDGERLGSCCGGGYDLRGTAFAAAMMSKFGPELLTLANRALSRYTGKEVPPTGKKRKPTTTYDRQPTPERQPDTLYGLTAYFNEQGNPVKIYMDGACGLQSMEYIMEAIGWKLEYVTENVSKLIRVRTAQEANAATDAAQDERGILIQEGWLKP